VWHVFSFLEIVCDSSFSSFFLFHKVLCICIEFVLAVLFVPYVFTCAREFHLNYFFSAFCKIDLQNKMNRSVQYR
jgi:hypothetical protein